MRSVYVAGGAHTPFIGKFHPDFIWRKHPDFGVRENPDTEGYLRTVAVSVLEEFGVAGDVFDRVVAERRLTEIDQLGLKLLLPGGQQPLRIPIVTQPPELLGTPRLGVIHLDVGPFVSSWIGPARMFGRPEAA